MINKKNIVRFIFVFSINFLYSCKTKTNAICIYGIDSLTDGAYGNSYRKFFDKEYENYHQNAEPGYIHLDYETSKDLDIGYWKSPGLKNMASEKKYSIDPIKYSISGKGIYGFNLSNEGFTYNIKDRPFSKARIYYLQRPDGGSFRYRFLNTKKENSIQQSMKGELKIKYVELNRISKKDKIINVFDINGNAAFYGIWYFNSKEGKPMSSIINIAKGGMTLNKVMTLDRSFRRYWYAQFNPEIVLFNAGTNDRLKIKGKTFKNLMNNYIEDLLLASPKTNFILVEPNQTIDYNTSFARDYTKIRKEIAKEKGIKLLDIPKLIGDYNYFVDHDLMSDGVHPNEKGFKLISDVTLKYLNIK